MIAKTKSLFIGAALLVTGGVANAVDPMVLTTSQMDTVTAGGGFSSFTDITKYFNIDERIREDKRARFDVRTFVKGNSAVAEGVADAFGKDTDAQTFTFAQTGPNYSNSASKSIALTGGGNFSCHRCKGD